MLEKFKTIASVFMVTGVILLIKLPLVGGILAGAGLLFWPFYLLLHEKAKESRENVEPQKLEVHEERKNEKLL